VAVAVALQLVVVAYAVVMRLFSCDAMDSGVYTGYHEIDYNGTNVRLFEPYSNELLTWNEAPTDAMMRRRQMLRANFSVEVTA
jgi:hypothetical protein